MSNKKHVWHEGPPPSVGWWPASVSLDVDILRWWNGESWSIHATTDFDMRQAGKAAAIKERATSQSVILWTDRPKNWPKRSKT